ncbi:MAG: hypothetical protein R2873_10500 [Caldilineaceae bacterium]
MKTALLADGSVIGVVAAPLDEWGRLRVLTPAGLLDERMEAAGRYVLARCAAESGVLRGEDWGIYARRPLFIAGRMAWADEEEWSLFVPNRADDPGYAWLATRPAGSTINLLGPLGNGFQIHAQSRNLALVADLRRPEGQLSWLMPLVEPMIARGGRVTLVIRSDAPLSPALLDTLPLALEVHAADSDDGWRQILGEAVKWADQVCAALPSADFSSLHELLRGHRFHVDSGFCQVLVHADLLCGVGACLACVVPLPRGGWTRACVHGPVFDLNQLVG